MTRKNDWFRCAVLSSFEAAAAMRRGIRASQIKAGNLHPLVKVYRLADDLGEQRWAVYLGRSCRPDPATVAAEATDPVRDPYDLYRLPQRSSAIPPFNYEPGTV